MRPAVSIAYKQRIVTQNQQGGELVCKGKNSCTLPTTERGDGEVSHLHVKDAQQACLLGSQFLTGSADDVVGHQLQHSLKGHDTHLVCASACACG